ncbi:MAG: flavodoxin family protein [Desulfobacterales bacterium]|nr:flavodoxin family protein [Desulfobacterales bacterium]
MMQKILGVMGSPRKKGNTHLLISKILEGAQSEGVAGEILFLDDLTIRECDGCHRCWKGKRCNKDDDMNGIYPRIMESSGIVFGTPVYWYGPTALIKGFIDRFVYFNCAENRAGIKGKPAVLAVPCEEADPAVADLVKAMFEKSLRYLEMDLIGTIIVPGVTKKGEIIKKQGPLEEAYNLGIRLARFMR